MLQLWVLQTQGSHGEIARVWAYLSLLFSTLFWCGNIIRIKDAFLIYIYPLWDTNWKKHLHGELDCPCGSAAPASVPPLPRQAWSQALRPACLNIRFNWGLPAYQRQYGNFYEGKGLPRCWPDLSLLSLLHNLVLSHQHFPPSERLRLLGAVFVQDGVPKRMPWLGEPLHKQELKMNKEPFWFTSTYLCTARHGTSFVVAPRLCGGPGLNLLFSSQSPSSYNACISRSLHSCPDLRKICG